MEPMKRKIKIKKVAGFQPWVLVADFDFDFDLPNQGIVQVRRGLAQADAIRGAVGSVVTCTPATSALLKTLLLPPKDDTTTADDNTSGPNSRPGSKATTRRPRTNTTVSRAPSRRARAAPTPTPTPPTATESGLSTREKASLATHVVNATLKALGEAAKAVPPPAASRPTTEDEEVTGKAASARSTLRRSSSAPMSPLQPRSLNTRSPSRTASSAGVSNTTTTPPPSTNLLSTVECARVALTALRQLPASGKVTLPELQLESGMSALVGRLISLNLQDTAIKELRTLKRRLDGLTCSSDAGKKGPKPEEPKNAAQLFSELLDFSSVQTSACQPPLLQLVVSTQLQILRVLALAKKPSATEAALPHLRLDQPSSPASLLLAAAAQDANADKSKPARQIETIAQCFLALTPSVARKDDALGQETRLSVSPASALELQLLALETRLHCWALSGKHKGDAEKDVLLPLSRCLAAYLRRTSEIPRSSYALCSEGFARVEKMLLSQKQGFQPAKGSKQPLAGIYQTLLALARDAGQIADALNWAEKLQDVLDHGPAGESVAKMCAVAAQRLVLFLKQTASGSASGAGSNSLSDTALGLLKQVVDGIQGPLRGDSGELDELLTQVCAVRKAGMQLLLAMAKEGGERGDTQNQLETFILQCPRFCLRWLGKPPDPKSKESGKDTTTTTKEILRYDQRRQLVRPYLPHLLDSAFLTIKTGLDHARLQWEVMDAVLGDCLTLLQYTSSASESVASSPASSYYVKISHFYYLQYTALRQQTSTDNDSQKNNKRDALRALRHSIDAVRHRPRAERAKAQLTLKLERMAEMCRSLGRADEALAALQAIRRTLVEDGVLLAVARRLRPVSPAAVWTGGTTDTEADVEALGRALSGIAKGQMSMPGGWVDWTGELDDEGEISSEEQRAAVWEHWVRFVLSLAGNGEEKGAGLEQDIGLDHPVVAALLAVYTPARYPIRRMRVLLMLLNAALGDITRAREVLGLLGDDALDISTPGKKPEKPLGQDTSLAPYLPHFQALSTALTSAVDAYHNSAALDQAVSIWKGLVASANHNKTALERLIDDIPGLLAYLESAADFLRVQGRHAARAGVLELVGDLTGVMGVVVQGRGEQEVQADLALQYTFLGQAERAEGVFRRVEEGLVLGNGDNKNGMSGEVRAGFHLAFAEHCILLGQARQAEEHLQRAQQAFVDDVKTKPDAAERAPKHVRAERRRMVSHAGYLYSLLALERGDSHHALAYARDSVRGLFQAWTKLEAGFQSKPKAITDHTSRPLDDNQTIDLSSLQPNTNNEPESTPLLWRLFPPLYRAVLRLSALYAHLGMFQETMYYAEQARKMADAVRSDVYRAECAVWMAGVLWRAGEGERDRAGGLVREAVGLLGLAVSEDELGGDQGKGKGGYVTAALACRVGEMHLRQGDVEGARAVLERAEGMVEGLARGVGTETDEVQAKMAKLAIAEQQTKKPVRRKTVKTPARAGKTAVRKTTKTTAKTATTTATAPAPAPVATPTQETTTQANTQLAQLRASILVQKAVSMLRQHDWAAAQDALTAAAAVSIGTTATTTVSTSDVLPAVAMASCLLGMSMEQMAEDPVFSVIQDSTISFPAVGDTGESGLLASPGTVVRGRGGPGLGSAAGTRLISGAKKPGLGSQYVDHLREAHDYLLDAHAVAALRGDASLVHRISGMLQNVGLFLAATSGKTRPGKTITEPETHPSSAQTSYSVELARNLTWRRERRALAQEKNSSSSSSSDTWPSTLLPSTTGAGGPRRSSLGFTLDLHRIQRDYIDLVPSSWNLLSLSLSLGENDTHDLCITKFQAGQTPFVLRLPLERASSRDADSDVFDFAQGRAELLEIIGGINRTCHEAKGPTSFSSSSSGSGPSGATGQGGGEKNGADARAAWWAEREALDTRLGSLLENIEQIWLGGFRGIFSQHTRRARHLARFQRDFVAVLDQYLPSRRQVGRGKKAASASSTSGGSGSRGGETKKATLDPNVLELFIGLGDASRPGCDFDEELTDLLYFVVDILQFHGERNAYDEIAFDGMAVATMDALRAYWAGVGDDERHEGSDEDEKEEGGEKDGKTTHTILLLDKALHVFPWESLPCMQGLAVSRLPSLACLRRLLLDRREAGGLNNSNNNKNDKNKKQKQAKRPGHYISPHEGGTYILNPSGDLTSTQATFAQPLANLSSSSQSTTTSSQAETVSPWTSILTRPPTEPEFTHALSHTPLLLYFGHGSGAQYIRGRTIRRLDPRCRATVLLMGCSSAALSDNGEFEPAGPVWNYLMAGCPAVVGTLWDVTDRDVDRWGGGVLEDLVEAVATARGRCRFRFVTAAAAVVYGIPVYVERG
ncbi:peptidase family C50-domain-containing protein [Chaetomium sp. MPI-SDFR-AT-0129]|nr:peptidase family C50-domain-containing protein [Chaetomium sp. MPI-SDFR-AT-0129]